MKHHRSNDIPDQSVLDAISKSASEFMDPIDSDKFKEKLEGRSNVFFQWVEVGDDVVGFKVGYELRPKVFYSWLGGVTPKFRGKGVATKLMEDQHEFCISNGYETVMTISSNHRKEMMIANLKAGFDIVQTKENEKDGIRVVFEKKLA